MLRARLSESITKLLCASCVIIIVLASYSPIRAHEFWIDPAAYTLPPGGEIVADLRVGEDMEGSAQTYLPYRFMRFEMHQGARRQEIAGRLGDRPALRQPSIGEGLTIIAHVTTNSRLVYREFDKFQRFVTNIGDAEIAQLHRESGFPLTGFAEAYSRHAKSLIAVGSGEGADRPLGMEVELVAQKNPYTLKDDLVMPLQILTQGKPRAQGQVEVFSRSPDGVVHSRKYRANDQGIVSFPVEPGNVYLASYVLIRSAQGTAAQMDEVIWESLWASVTFAVPTQD